MKSITVIFIVFICFINGSVLITRYDENMCSLDPKLIEEIASYKNITKRIMDEIKLKDYGAMMYREYTKFIDNFGARPAGTDNLEKAIDHMINLTRANGLDDITTEEVKLSQWVRGRESAEMIAPHHKDIAILGFGTSVGTPLEGITGEVIVVKNFEDLDKMDDKEVKGKIVVYDAHFETYGKTVIYRSQGASRASKKGAVASLVRSITPFSIYSLHTGSQFYDKNVTKIPTAAITLEDADLFRRLQDQGQKIEIKLIMNSTVEEKISRNTMIDLKGAVHPEKQVIVSGHINSWDVGQGAMDDGGGMMISWFVPVVLKFLHSQPKRTIRAILWTAEEPGLIGAASYLNNHLNDLSKINFIMESDEGTFKPLGLDVAGTNKARCVIAEILKLFTPIDNITESGSPGSDIGMFIRKGVPGASLLNQNEKYFWFHHSEGDTMNVQTKSDVIDCAVFWAAFSYVVADLSIDIPP